jgi:transcription termination factor Rho
MSVLERSELEASPLADLHAIANQLGLDGFRRLRKADLIDAILSHSTAEGAGGVPGGDAPPASRRRGRSQREDSGAGDSAADQGADSVRGGSAAGATDPEESEVRSSRGRRPGSRRRRSARSERDEDARSAEAPAGADAPPDGPEDRSGDGRDRVADGMIELLGNGSAFLRVDPPEPSDDDVYISAAQVRRCELVSGDRVSGPVRAPRRSERYPSLIRVDTINDAPADAVAEGTHFEDLPAAFPTQRFALGTEDPTLRAIEWLTPLGRGSRAVIVGCARAGKTETLRRLAQALQAQEGVEVSLVLAGVRPEEVGEWREGTIAPTSSLTFAASPDAQGQAVERAVDTARRVAARGGNAVVLIDTLDGVHPPVARKALAAARSIVDGGSLTVIATAGRAFGGETTVIALDVALTSTGRLPAVDLVNSGTVHPELLVGEAGADAISQARASALA